MSLKAEPGFAHKCLIPEAIILNKPVKHWPSPPSGEQSQVGAVGSVGTGISVVSGASSPWFQTEPSGQLAGGTGAGVLWKPMAFPHAAPTHLFKKYVFIYLILAALGLS